jgi:hypothetical protein
MFRRAHISENNNILFAPHSVLSLHLINPSTVGSGLSHPTAHIHIGRAPITEPYRPRNCQRVTSGLCHASPPYLLGPPSDNTMTVSRAVRENYLPLVLYRLPTSLLRHAHVSSTRRPVSTPARQRSDMSATYAIPVDHSQAATSLDDVMLTSPDPDPT